MCKLGLASGGIGARKEFKSGRRATIKTCKTLSWTRLKTFLYSGKISQEFESSFYKNTFYLGAIIGILWAFSKKYWVDHFQFGSYRWSPPYHYLIFCSFEFLCLTLQWIACVHYISKTCPDTLVGTMVALVGATQNVLGKPKPWI